MARYDDDRRYGRYSDRDDRGLMNRASDEVRSWFGDDDAERRRRRDEMRGDRDVNDRRSYGTYGPRDSGDRDYGDRDYRSRTYGSRTYGDRDYDGDRDYRGSSRNYGDRDYGDRYRTGSLSRGRDEDYLQERYDRDYNRDYVRDFGDHSGYRGRYEGDRLGGSRSYRSGYGSDRGDYESNRGYGSRRGYGSGQRYDRDYGDQSRGSYDYVAYYAIYDGPHSGRGPEGYSRSTDRIEEDVNERLTDHGGLDASKVRVSADEGEVTLEGTVQSRREKRMAEDAAESVRGVRDVHNRLHISQTDEDSFENSNATNASASSTSGKKSRKSTASS